MKKYFTHQLKKVINANSILTLEYLELSADFSYPEEVHDFYELAYIDSGRLKCVINGEETELNQSDFFFITPGTKHFYKCTHKQSAVIFILCFSSKSDIIDSLEGKTVLDKDLKRLISDLVTESKNAFKTPFDKKIEPLETPKFGAQQLVENYLEQFLIKLTRQKLNDNTEIKFILNSVELENNITKDIIAILKENVYGQITLDDISGKIYFSKTYINNIFKKNTGRSIINYYNFLKITEAKKLLRENKSVSVISELLCFDNPNYFTKVFKKFTEITPSQYKKTIF